MPDVRTGCLADIELLGECLPRGGTRDIIVAHVVGCKEGFALFLGDTVLDATRDLLARHPVDSELSELFEMVPKLSEMASGSKTNPETPLAG